MTPQEKLELYKDLVKASEDYTIPQDEKVEIRKMRAKAFHDIEPFVGMPCSIVYWSDIRAATVTEVEYFKNGKPKAVTVTHNKVKCIDWYGNEYEILPELEDGWTDRFTARRNGKWYEEGQETSPNSVRLMLHYQTHSIDPTF